MRPSLLPVVTHLRLGVTPLWMKRSPLMAMCQGPLTHRHQRGPFHPQRSHPKTQMSHDRKEARSHFQSSLIQPHTSRQIRRSFESVIAKFAQIPDDDDGGIPFHPQRSHPKTQMSHDRKEARSHFQSAFDGGFHLGACGRRRTLYLSDLESTRPSKAGSRDSGFR
jgi:hypothetical protein